MLRASAFAVKPSAVLPEANTKFAVANSPVTAISATTSPFVASISANATPYTSVSARLAFLEVASNSYTVPALITAAS
jgi:hypothetical protein